MSITRREICFLLPGFLPVAAQLHAFAQGKSLASGAFSFDKAQLHVANNNAQVRMMLRGKLGTGEAIEVKTQRSRFLSLPAARWALSRQRLPPTRDIRDGWRSPAPRAP